MSQGGFDKIIQNYELLTHHDAEVREQANNFLMSLIDEEAVWKITQEMITNSSNQNYQLLGAQILSQKIERDASDLNTNQLHSLKEFTFKHLNNPQFSLPTLRKLANCAAVVSAVLLLDHWPSFLNDLVVFMKHSIHNIKVGLLILGNLAEQLKLNNRIRHALKVQIQQKILEQFSLLQSLFISAFELNQTSLLLITLQSIQSWVKINFPLLKSTTLVTKAIHLINTDQQMFLQICCKVLSETLEIAAREKNQTLNIVQFQAQMLTYNNQEKASLGLLIQHFRSNRAQLIGAISQGRNLQNIQTYLMIVKELLLSFSFILLDQAGLQLLQIMVSTLQSPNLRLSYSTFNFWNDFISKMARIKLNSQLQARIYQVVHMITSIIFAKTALQNQSSLNQLIKDDDTLDDITQVSFPQYRKEAQNILRVVYDFYTAKKQNQGSNLFFGRVMQTMNQFKTRNQLVLGVQLSIYIVKSLLQSLVKDFDSLNLVQYIQTVMDLIGNGQVYPRIAAQLMHLIQDCSRQIREKDSLFLKCLSFSLKNIQNQSLCNYAIYAFSALIETIQQLSNQQLIYDLLEFYSKNQFVSDTIVEKLLNGILTSMTKLPNRQTIAKHMERVMTELMTKNNNILQTNSTQQSAYQVSLAQNKTFLDSFEHIQAADKQFFRAHYLKISTQAVVILNNFVRISISQRRKFANVKQLGICLALTKNSLNLCQNMPFQQMPIAQYLTLANTILSIINTSDLQIFFMYQSLLQIVCQVIGQFNDKGIPPVTQWIVNKLPLINNFFLGYAYRYQNSIKDFDPDIMKWYYSLQASILLYDEQIYLSQKQHQDILTICLFSVAKLTQKNMQKKVVYFLYQCCTHKHIYANRIQQILKIVFASIPLIDSICYLNLGRTLILLLEDFDSRKKQNIIRQLLQYAPYQEVSADLKEIIAKFLTFALESKVQRYFKGVLGDLKNIKWKTQGPDFGLHLEMRFANWKREYARTKKQQSK